MDDLEKIPFIESRREARELGVPASETPRPYENALKATAQMSRMLDRDIRDFAESHESYLVTTRAARTLGRGILNFVARNGQSMGAAAPGYTVSGELSRTPNDDQA